MAMLLDDAPAGLNAADFDLYAPARWSNNQFNLGRMKAKERLRRLCEPLTAQPGAAGLALECTAEVPGVWNGRSVRDQWVYLIRPAALRQRLAPLVAERLGPAAGVRDPADHQHHPVVFVRLHLEGLEVGCRLPAGAVVDVETLSARDAAKRQALLARLPSPLALDGTPPATAFDAALSALRTGDREDLRISTTLDRETVIAAGPELTAVIAALWAPCLALHGEISFRPDDDPAGIEGRARALDLQRAADAAARAEVTAAEAREREARSMAARARTAERAEADAAWRRRWVAPRPVADALPLSSSVPASAVTPATPAAPPAPPAPPAPMAAAPPPAPPAPAAVPTLGCTVRLSRGLLAGREGQVTAGPDAKGYFKVRVGTLEVQIPGAELRPT